MSQKVGDADDTQNCVIIRLRTFMQICIFTNTVKQVGHREITPLKHCNTYSILDIFYNFAYYAQLSLFETFKFLINA